jgi:hypothetical protein
MTISEFNNTNLVNSGKTQYKVQSSLNDTDVELNFALAKRKNNIRDEAVRISDLGQVQI